MVVRCFAGNLCFARVLYRSKIEKVKKVEEAKAEMNK
jgi:hypothetical protein